MSLNSPKVFRTCFAEIPIEHRPDGDRALIHRSDGKLGIRLTMEDRFVEASNRSKFWKDLKLREGQETRRSRCRLTTTYMQRVRVAAQSEGEVMFNGDCSRDP